MRWVFLSLVCLNLLVMVWFWREQGSEALDIKPSVLQQGESLVLVSELQPELLNYKETTLATASGGARCYSVGPLKDSIDAKHIQVRAEALGFEAKMRALSTGSEVEHWVHVPPLADRSAALQLLRELHQRKIDSYVVTQGELAEGISLGLFRNKESATNLMLKMNDLGYGVEIKEVLRGAKELWLEFPQITQLTEAMRMRIIGEGTGLEWMLTDCSN